MNAPQSAEYVATCVAAPSGLAEKLLKEIASLTENRGGRAVWTEWLSEGEAVDVFCTGLAADEWQETLCQKFGASLDIIVQPVAKRRKKLLLADMESTIIEQEMLDELAEVIGLRDQVAEITRRAMNGELDFAAALRERVSLLKDQPVSILTKVMERITLMDGAAALVSAMRRHDATCWLVSGGFTCFVQPVAVQLNFDEAYANTLVLRDGVIDGHVIEPILDKETKRALLENACARLNLSLDDTVTVGDGANDIPMLMACHNGGGLGVAYHAKPHVRRAVPNQINHGNLAALLYAQGYKREEVKG